MIFCIEVTETHTQSHNSLSIQWSRGICSYEVKQCPVGVSFAWHCALMEEHESTLPLSSMAVYRLIPVATPLAAIPPTRSKMWNTLLAMEVTLHLRARWKRGGRMKAKMVVARLPTRARQSSKRGIPTAILHETMTRSVRRIHSIV